MISQILSARNLSNLALSYCENLEFGAVSGKIASNLLQI
ncbi:MAG: hypothetical protein OFPII_20800 [Osedax symbiont Rs1]|nr:MAG: hypothetical protein OFPII_20800 [Osedax symbiont Rs1]